MRNKNIILILNYVVGPLVFCILIFAIHKQVHRQADWRESLARIQNVFSTKQAGIVAAVFILMFFNWGLEARKWQVALRASGGISFLTAFKGVLSGTTMAFFTPNRVGEYLGRMIHVERAQRISSVPLTIVCSMAQLMVTLFVGIGGLLYLAWTPNVIFWINLLLYTVLAASLVLTIFYFRLSWLVKAAARIPAAEKMIRYVRILDKVNATLLLRILSLSTARYLVFMIQYYLLFQVFGVEVSWWQSFWAVSVVFLVIAVVPSVAVLTELGIRWETSIEILQMFSTNTAGILAASLATWIINLVIPALVGSLLIFGVKFLKNT